MKTIHPLKAYRKTMGLTLIETSKALGISTASVSRIENGFQGVSPELAERIETWSRLKISRMELLYPDEFGQNRAIL